MVSNKLKRRHNYKRFADNCKNCRHFVTQSNYENIDGMYTDSCHVDASPYNVDQDVYILHNPWGMCDEHESTGKINDNT